MAVVIAVAILGLAAAAVMLLPVSRVRLAAALAGGAAVAAPLFLLVAASRSGIGPYLESDLGGLLPGVQLIVRVALWSLAVVGMGSVALLLSLAECERRPEQCAANLLAFIGCVVVACGGNAVLMAAGVGIVVVSTLLAANCALTRLGRASLAVFALGVVSTALLVLSAVELQWFDGTSDFVALPVGALTWWVVLPCACAAAFCLTSVVVTPRSVRTRAGLASATVGVIPAGVAVLVHLQEAAAGQLESAGMAVLGITGCVIGIVAAVAALRVAARPMRALCWLSAAAAGPVIVLAGASGDARRLGFGAAVVGLALYSLVAAAGLPANARRSGFLVAGPVLGLALGFGLDAAFVGVGAEWTGGGPEGLWLAIGLAVIASLNFAAAVLVAWHSLARSSGSEGASSLANLAVLGAVGFTAVAPGVVMAGIGVVMGSSGQAVDAFSAGVGVRSWPGGYFVAGVALMGAAGWALVTLLDVRLGAVGGEVVNDDPVVVSRRLLSARRWSRPFFARVRRVLATTDAWLLDQPRFGVVVLAAGIALLVIR